MKHKIFDLLGYSLFLGLLVIISPYLFITGGILRIKRYYLYVKSGVKDKEPEKYTIYF